jgi:hypothetical protein
MGLAIFGAIGFYVKDSFPCPSQNISFYLKYLLLKSIGFTGKGLACFTEPIIDGN